jgi:hypothetical protein
VTETTKRLLDILEADGIVILGLATCVLLGFGMFMGVLAASDVAESLACPCADVGVGP